MFNFFKRKKKKSEEHENKEVIRESGQELTNDNSNSNSDDKTNEEFNKFNEVNKNNNLIDKIVEKFDEVKEEVKSGVEKLEDKTEEITDDVKSAAEKAEAKAVEVSEEVKSEVKDIENKVEEKSSNIKAGRFIDLTKTENTEKKTLKTEDEKLKEQQEENPEKKSLNIPTEEEIHDFKLEETEEPVKEKESIFDRLKKGLTKTRDSFTSSLTNLFTRNVKIDDDLYDELEEILISADIGMNSTIEIVDELRGEIKKRSIKEADKIYPVLKEIMIKNLDENNLNNEIKFKKGKLTVILVIGVNGVGKTTTIGKLANNFKNEGKTVMLAAADTFRAAAIDQLQEWAKKADVELISHKEGADPSAVIFDAIKSARSKDVDVLICDTAGRLHNKKNLMQELDKINRTIDTHAVNSNRENLLVLDATTGQNAVSQLREFKNVTEITGLILTKLDGTAKGGVIFPLQVEVEVPVKYIGVGEGIDHLQKFDSKSFVEAMF
ncbi:fused signal recognition particle receptor [Anaerococcus degeneri]|nr:fused signal recognition particle receptor [Anaerococcus degeneri]